MTNLTKMEIEGMKRGAFPMSKDEGIEACKKFRAELEARGKRTWLEHFAGDIFVVKFVNR